MRRLLLALLAALLLAGCGEERGQGEGTASLWITRDRGEEVVLTADVPAGLTAMQALERKAADLQAQANAHRALSSSLAHDDAGEP